jgi:diguanylate cyclase (GGDEF)-like protein
LATSGPTIGVLSTSFGGTYFGSVLDGIRQATSAVGGRIIAIQTLDAGTVGVDVAEPPPFRPPVAQDHVTGFVTILNAADKHYLSAIRDAGTPVVMISDDLPGFSCPVVLPDNQMGIREAVAHLVGHGHSAIAFAGYPVQRDFRERFDAYRGALVEHGIQPREDLFFGTGNSQESGGDNAARAMIAADMPSTAVIAGNDLNAIGLMRTLAKAGYELPRQQAIVGFDDMEGGVYLTPSLSSVRQQFDAVGVLAVELVLRQLAGEEVSSGLHYVATSFVPRESCGCPDTLALGEVAPLPSAEPRTPAEMIVSGEPAISTDPAGSAGPDVPGRLVMPPPVTAESLADRLGEVLGVPAGQAEGVLHRAGQGIVDAVRAASHGTRAPEPFRLRSVLAELHELQRRPEGLVAIMRCVRAFGRHLAVTARTGGDEAAAERVEVCVQELMVALAQSQARAQFRDGNYFQSTLSTQYKVSMNLLRSHEEQPRMLAWIEGTHASGGCLGMWADGDAGNPAGEAMLDRVTVFERGRHRQATAMPAVTARAFPPAEVVALADLAADDMVYIAPMKVNRSDRGMLAIVGPMESLVPTGREMMNQWTALLTIALDHEDVLDILREREERLQQVALYDQLTGLANRTLFMERLQHSIARAKRRPEYAFAVLLLDLDGFKGVNDSLGHLAGDELLVQVSSRIRECTREPDIAARFGGDEFAVLLDDIAAVEDPVAVAERIHTALKAPSLLGDEEVVVSSSIGIALSTAGYDNAEDVIRDADTAMYTVKWRGKDSHAIFNGTMHAKAVDRLRMESDLRRAQDSGELMVHYQPIVCLDTGQVVAVESLIRWQHPTRGLLNPDEFLPVAEESGLALPMGRWGLTEACRQLHQWQVSDAAPQALRMTVNVSNRQFWHGRLLEDIRDCLRLTGVAPQQLILEITEGVIMHDLDLARRMVAELHRLGVRVHIDCFGTGYSSLEVICGLPIDALKIDRSFVARLGDDQRSIELVRTIVLMGSNLNLDVIAEGIETADQLAHLRRAGCRYGQGYLFCAPVPGGEAADFMRAVASAPAAHALVHVAA